MNARILDLFAMLLLQARAALFAGLFFGVLLLSHYVQIPGLYRYDFIFIAAVGIQILLIVLKLETREEARYILIFHMVGFVLEVYKTNPSIGSWSYPEPGLFKLLDVPLYSGFMYAAVGSCIAQAWRVLQVRLEYPPRYVHAVFLGLCIYLNFFTNHFITDFRPLLFGATVLLYARTWVHVVVRTTPYRIPLIGVFACLALLVWVAENISTYLGAWQYPSQVDGWELVSFSKVGSWFLLVIICFTIVSYLKHERQVRARPLSRAE